MVSSIKEMSLPKDFHVGYQLIVETSPEAARQIQVAQWEFLDTPFAFIAEVSPEDYNRTEVVPNDENNAMVVAIVKDKLYCVANLKRAQVSVTIP